MTYIQFNNNYEHIISMENLLEAWKEFVRGKRARKDVQEFERNLMANVLSLHSDLVNKSYRHSAYEAFTVFDPKTRDIHKASVRDRLLHHAIYKLMYPFFDKTFISHSYSCRVNKGTHKALNTFRKFAYAVSKNNTKTCWVLKCDIKKFFASIDQKILLNILKEYIPDKDIVKLFEKIIGSFHSAIKDTGLPLGNLTSQLLVNIYMNKLDQWMKHGIKVKYYIRYADDFAILSSDKSYLVELVPKIADFLERHLHLSLHPNKVYIKTFDSGVDFLGWVHFPHYRQIRKTTGRKIQRMLAGYPKKETISSYRGLLSHGNTYKFQKSLKISL